MGVVHFLIIVQQTCHATVVTNHGQSLILPSIGNLWCFITWKFEISIFWNIHSQSIIHKEMERSIHGESIMLHSMGRFMHWQSMMFQNIRSSIYKHVNHVRDCLEFACHCSTLLVICPNYCSWSFTKLVFSVRSKQIINTIRA